MAFLRRRQEQEYQQPPAAPPPAAAPPQPPPAAFVEQPAAPEYAPPVEEAAPSPESVSQFQPVEGYEDMLDMPLGTLIFRAGLIAPQQLEDALAEGLRTGKRLGEVLLSRGWLTELDLGRLLAGQKGLPFLDISTVAIDPNVARRVPIDDCRRLMALPLLEEFGVPIVALADPNEDTMETMRRLLGTHARFVVSPPSVLAQRIEMGGGAPAEPAPAPPPDPTMWEQPAEPAPPLPEPVYEQPPAAVAPEPVYEQPPAPVMPEPVYEQPPAAVAPEPVYEQPSAEQVPDQPTPAWMQEPPPPAYEPPPAAEVPWEAPPAYEQPAAYDEEPAPPAPAYEQPAAFQEPPPAAEAPPAYPVPETPAYDAPAEPAPANPTGPPAWEDAAPYVPPAEDPAVPEPAVDAFDMAAAPEGAEAFEELPEQPAWDVPETPAPVEEPVAEVPAPEPAAEEPVFAEEAPAYAEPVPEPAAYEEPAPVEPAPEPEQFVYEEPAAPVPATPVYEEPAAAAPETPVYEEPVFAPPAEPEPVPEPAAEEPFAPAASAEPAEGQIQDMNGAAPPPPPPATRGTLGDGLRPIGETPLVDYSLGAFDLDHIGRTPEPPPVAPPAPAQQPSPEQQSAPPPAAHEDAEPEGALLPFELTLRLADGERMVLGKFATEDEAQGGARTFAEQLKDNEWPNVNGRMIRREAIVSIDIEQNDAPGWAGSGNRGPWRDT